ncbi:MAG: HAD-IA family hydrolase [Candidatus Micrarchaeota archaeon]|nr:HAD-IA family hydrolase [Candidatus Micrarchaeota archaeon]
MHPRTRLFIFDIGGVVVKGTFATGYLKYLKRLGLLNSRQEPLIKGIYRKTQTGELPFRSMARLMAKRLGLDAEPFLKARSKQLDSPRLVDPKMLTMIRRLSRRNKIIFLTNISRDKYEALRPRELLKVPNARIFASYRLGMAKPDTRIYRHVLKAMRAKPEQAVFIDDKQSNVDGARRLRITSIRFEGYGKLRRRLSAMRLL